MQIHGSWISIRCLHMCTRACVAKLREKMALREPCGWFRWACHHFRKAIDTKRFPVDSSRNGDGTTSRHLQDSIQRSTSAVLITLMAQLQMRLVIWCFGSVLPYEQLPALTWSQSWWQSPEFLPSDSWEWRHADYFSAEICETILCVIV